MRALAALRIDDQATARAVVQLLDLRRVERSAVGSSPSPAATHSPADTGTDTERRTPPPSPPPVLPPPSGPPMATELVSLPDMPPPSLAWLGDRLPLTLASIGDDNGVPIDPLFPPAWTTHIITAALATDDNHGALDVEALVTQLARGEPVRALQYLPERTLRRGAQILCDHSDAMLPFRPDEAQLINRIRRVLGDCVDVLRFAGLPWRVGAGARRRWTAWKPPSQGTPVVLVTDLGIGRAPGDSARAAPSAWHEFASAVAAAGCPLVAFVPYPPHRWPEALLGALAIIMWDRSTAASTASRAREARR